MRTEKVATIECLIGKDAKEIYYLVRSPIEGENFWFYTFENDKEIIKAFAVEPSEPNVYIAEMTEVEEHLKELKDKSFPTPCIISYEIEYLNVSELSKEIGFKPLSEWYEEFLRYVDEEVLKLLSEDFPTGFWKAYKEFYKQNEDFRKLLSIERYELHKKFSSVLSYVKQVIENKKPKDYVKRLYGEEFVDWLCEVASRL
jgi:hypothetical protein